LWASLKPDVLFPVAPRVGPAGAFDKRFGPWEERAMPTYLTIGKYTAQGLNNIKDAPKRAKAFKEAAEKAGVKIKELAWLVGDYDVMVLAEAPDEQTVIALGLGVSKQGNVVGTRMRVVDADEFEKILKRVP
jgi:uncharacterized protein with GYD domain